MTELRKTFYDDVGEVSEFCILADDVWKKDEVFTSFSVRLLRMIAMEVGVPVDKIGWGKWGGRIIIDDEDDETLKKWYEAIESHPIYQKFKEVCAFATYRKYGEESEEELMDSLNAILSFDNAKFMVSYLEGRESLKKDAKEDLSPKDYKRLLQHIKRNG